MTSSIHPGAGELNRRVFFQRREALDPSGPGDGAGNYEGDWAPLFGWRSVKLVPTRGGEGVVADRVQGTSILDLWVRSDSETRTVAVGDRVEDARDANLVFNIRWIGDLDDRRMFLLMQVELGVAT